MTQPFDASPLSLDPRLARCNLCPRRCGADRFSGPAGACASGAGLEVAAVCLHTGEEPVLGGAPGVCNVFFSGCNLRCIFCQNYQVSRGGTAAARRMDAATVMKRIHALLNGGCDTLGLVSPSHVSSQVKALLTALNMAGLSPTVVHNGNGYDDPSVLKELAGKVDIYLPDMKYADGNLSLRLSGVKDYPDVAFAALEEMIRQVGRGLETDARGVARHGLIVRHLVLPGCLDNSISLLRKLADRVGTAIHLSLMAQYRPPAELDCPPPLNRRLCRAEYDTVVDEALRLGFTAGWFQDPDSADNHVPDFSSPNPFEKSQ